MRPTRFHGTGKPIATVANYGIALKRRLAGVHSAGIKFVEAAINAAAVIVTYNVSDFRSPDLTPHGWTVMTPREFLARYQ